MKTHKENADIQKGFQDPKILFQTAIQELEIFTHPEASHLEVNSEGHIVASKETSLEKAMRLASSFIAPIFSLNARQHQQKQMHRLKQAVLHALDTIQTLSPLFEKFKQGNESEKKLLQSAMDVISRYNQMLDEKKSDDLRKKLLSNPVRNALLCDKEIKNKKIEIPHVASVLYDSDSEKKLSVKMLEILRQTQRVGVLKKITTIHKENSQFMVDTFRLKARRLAQTHLHQLSFLDEVYRLIQSVPVETYEDSISHIIHMQQMLEIGPGSWIVIRGAFKKNQNALNPTFMTMPILDSFGLSSQVFHSGFPYPSQHVGWTLGESWVAANPLRSDQVPLFFALDQQKKELAKKILFDPDFSHYSREIAKQKEHVFNAHASDFISLHRTLQEELRCARGLTTTEREKKIFDDFYDLSRKAPSCFRFFSSVQQKIIDLFIKEPLQSLQEEWLSPKKTALRFGDVRNRLEAASEKLEQQICLCSEKLQPHHPEEAFIALQGTLMGETFKKILLQHQSEKIKFAPPMLDDFERRLQICAFEELLTFFNEFEQFQKKCSPQEIRDSLEKEWVKKIQIVNGKGLEESWLSSQITNELECYFNTRYNEFRASSSHPTA